MGVLWYVGTVCLFRGRLVSPSGLAGVRVANLIGLLSCVFFFVLCLVLPVSLDCPFLFLLQFSFTIPFIYIRKVKKTSWPNW